MNRGIVYVMSNELFPDLVKIGVTGGTTAEAVEKRRKRLSSSENMPPATGKNTNRPFWSVCVCGGSMLALIEQKTNKNLPNLCNW